MTIKTHEFEDGHITYRLPTIGQAMTLLGYMGISTQEDKAKELADQSELVAIGKLVDRVPDYVVDLCIKNEDGQDVIDIKEAVETPEAAGPLSAVAIELFEYCMKLQGASKKKPVTSGKKATKKAPAKSAKSRRTSSKRAAR